MSICLTSISAAPLGLNKCVPIINPGLAPWAMQEYRPYRAPLHLPNQFTLLLLTSFAIVIDYCVTFVVQARVTHTNRSWTVVSVGGSIWVTLFLDLQISNSLSSHKKLLKSKANYNILLACIIFSITFVGRGCRLIPKGNAPRSSRVLKDLGFYFALVSSKPLSLCVTN